LSARLEESPETQPNAAAQGTPKRRLHIQMLVALFVGLVSGLLVNAAGDAQASWLSWTVTNVTQPIGQVFLRLVFMLVLPLIFSALVLAVVEVGDIRSLGRTGWRTAVFTIAGACVAVGIGLLLVNLVRPGTGVEPEVARRLLARTAGGASAIVGRGALPAGASLVELIPSNVVQAAADNQLLPVMVFALFFGIGMVLTPGKATETFRGTMEGLFNISMTLIGIVIRAAPVAIACLVFNLAANFGWDLLRKLGMYVGVVLAALALHLLVYCLVIRVLGRMSPLQFLRLSQEALLVAFSTASSSATLPTTLLVAEQRLHLPRRISQFVLTIGAATSHHGTALFEGVTVLFLAQFFGVHLGLLQQLAVMILCVLASIGTAAVPAGSLPVIAAILALFQIPTEGIGLILGVDRFLDMCRTAINVAGDLTATLVISRLEGRG
jgi:Na+/H+-dicarboxylate symporter